MRFATLSILAVIMTLCLFHLACSLEEEQALSDASPQLASATQAAEKIQREIDPIAQQAQHVADTVRDIAQDGATIGVPHAAGVALAASLLGAVLGVYRERRSGTLPLRDALMQVVRSVDEAFPEKTSVQKAAMASLQNRQTEQLVNSIREK
jgi:hypothetical protein